MYLTFFVKCTRALGLLVSRTLVYLCKAVLASRTLAQLELSITVHVAVIDISTNSTHSLSTVRIAL